MSPSNKRKQVSNEDDSIRYKINTQYYNNSNKTAKSKEVQKPLKKANEEDQYRYMLPSILKSKKPEKKSIKVNFWSSKPPTRLQIKEYENQYRRHTISTTTNEPKSAVKVRKRVSFLPTPIFSDNHNPMVTVPDDLTIDFNADEVSDLQEDLNSVEAETCLENGLNKSPSKTNLSPRGVKRKQIDDKSNNSELEFFSKYVVQKLRRMDTNQRIYSENLINTVLMYGQLGKLSGKCKLTET